ncbi:MAG TPA: PEGA domain-containing protein [Myxococcales bacterium]|nr:PEGA domain-containing protein [Myxococcales bacterium]
MIETVSQPRYVALGPLSSSPGSRAFLAYENGPSGPLWPLVVVWVPEDVERDPDRMKALMEETERAVMIDHPNVNRVLGCEQLEEGWARVVEFADGETVRRILQAVQRAGRPALSPKEAARILADVCRGTHHVHEMGQAEGSVRWRLHGAIKPETVIAGFDGVAKITGYGANAVAPRDAFGPTATLRSQYLSPEEIERGAPATDRRSDIYSLGLVLYEAIAGKPPWSAEDPAFEYKMLSEPLPLEPLASASPGLRDVAVKALARVPADRFQTAGLMADALEATGPAAASEVAADLARLFPPDGPDRAARRQLLLTAGFVSDHLPRPAPRKRPGVPRAQTSVVPAVTEPPAAQAAKPITRPPTSFVPAATGPATPAPTPAAPASLSKAPGVPSRVATGKLPSRPPRASDDLEPPPRRRGVSPAVIVVASLGSAAVAAAAVYFLRPAPPPPRPPPAVAQAPAPAPAPPPAPAPAAVPDLSAAPLTAAAPVAPPPPLEPGVLELSSTPSMAVTIDGHPHGATPETVTVSAGTHVVHFRDARAGVDEERRVRVKPGAHVTLGYEAARAGMEISAPAGSKIFLDGKHVGNAPVGTLHFIAGHHVIKVVMGSAVFERPFDADANETLTLDAHPQQMP